MTDRQHAKPTGTPTTIPPSSTAPSPSTTYETSKHSAPASPHANAKRSEPHSPKPAATTQTRITKPTSHTSSKNAGAYHSTTNPEAEASAPGPQTSSASTPPSTTYEPSSNGHAGNSTDEHTNGQSPSYYPSTTINWTQLTPRHLGILQQIELPISFGHSEQEVATKLGVTTAVVKRCRAELRNTLETLT